MNKRYNILILGAGGKRAGYENSLVNRGKFTVIGSSSNWVEDTKNTVDVALSAPSSLERSYGDFLQKAIDQYDVDIVIPKSEQDLVYFAREGIDRFGDKVVISNKKALTRLSNKQTLAQELIQVGLYDMAVPALSAVELSQNPSMFPVVVKNKTGSGSDNVQVFHDIKSMNEGFVLNGGNRIVQTYHEGVHWIVDVLYTPNGKGPVFIPYRVLAKNNYISLDVIIDFAPDVLEACARLFSALESNGMEFRGQVNFDMVNQQNHRNGSSTWRVMDFNVRKGATCRYHMAAGFSYYDVLYDHLLWKDGYIDEPVIRVPQTLDRKRISNIEIPRVVLR